VTAPTNKGESWMAQKFMLRDQASLANLAAASRLIARA
jgi:hypothetical protein